MPRRASSGIMRDYRRVRAGLYRGARLMGSLSPWLDWATGGLSLGGLLRSVLRRQVRRGAGRAFSALEFGGGGLGDIATETLTMLIGRHVGARGRR